MIWISFWFTPAAYYAGRLRSDRTLEAVMETRKMAARAALTPSAKLARVGRRARRMRRQALNRRA